jgi:hypothetical protein
MSSQTVAVVARTPPVQEERAERLVILEESVLVGQCQPKDDVFVRIMPTALFASRDKKKPLKVGFMTIDNILASARAMSTRIKQSWSTFSTQKEANTFRKLTKALNRQQLRAHAKTYGVRVPARWLACLDAKHRTKYIRAAAHPSTITTSTGDVTLPLEPYWLGLWLGDGTTTNENITTADKEVVEYLHAMATRHCGSDWHWVVREERGKAKTYTLVPTDGRKRHLGSFAAINRRLMFAEAMRANRLALSAAGIDSIPRTMRASDALRVRGTQTRAQLAAALGIDEWGVTSLCALYHKLGESEFLKGAKAANPLSFAMFQAGVWQNKRIPAAYQMASRAQRLELFAGLMDSDGHRASRCRYEITQKSVPLANDLQQLAEGLGYFVRRITKMAVCTNAPTEEGRKGRPVEHMVIGGLRLFDVPVKLPHKRMQGDTIGSHLPLFEMGNPADYVRVLRRKMPWTPERDAVLVEAVKRLGVGRWAQIKREHEDLFRKFHRDHLKSRVTHLQRLGLLPPPRQPQAPGKRKQTPTQAPRKRQRAQ